MYADDLDAAEFFYGSILGLEVHSRNRGRDVFFRCGRAMFLVFNPEETSKIGRVPVPTHGSVGPGHVAFQIGAAEVEAWKEHLAQNGVALETDFSWPGGGRSLYFRDPAGNSVELATARVWEL